MRRTAPSHDAHRRLFILFALVAMSSAVNLSVGCGPGDTDGADPAKDTASDLTDTASDSGGLDTGSPVQDAGPDTDGADAPGQDSFQAPDTEVADSSTTDATDTCTPDCDGKACGADGCGGTCGTCADGESCTDAHQCEAPKVSFKADVLPILQQAGCAGGYCHAYPSPPAGLTLNPNAAHQSLVDADSTQCSDRLRVKAGAPEDSYLIDKLQGRNLCDGERMPLGKPSLADADIETIRRWIADGAPNN